MRFFILNWFGQANPSGLLINTSNIYNLGFKFMETIYIQAIFCLYIGKYAQFYSMYLVNVHRQIGLKIYITLHIQ
jgi:hypothetical protein